MAQGPTFDPPSNPPLRAPTCPACGKQMQLARAEPSPRYTNLDRHIFACECGEKAEFLVARKE
jgi:hypothetical protein